MITKIKNKDALFILLSFDLLLTGNFWILLFKRSELQKSSHSSQDIDNTLLWLAKNITR